MTNILKKLVSRPGLEPGTLALKDRKDGFTQGLGFAKVSPFFLC
jgi:hypothetical protein